MQQTPPRQNALRNPLLRMPLDAALTAMRLTAVLLTALLVPRLSHAEPADAPSRASDRANPYTTRPSVMLGLSQWLVLRGGNIAAQVKFGRFVVEYSHGQGLDFEALPALAMTRKERDAGVGVRVPWTTGGGFGWQITPELHVLVELKAHRYVIEDDFGGSLDYTSLTVGPGLFYEIYLYEGLFIQPNLRWWPTVASSYDGGTLRASDGSVYRHERHELLPFVNVNLGWTFAGS